MRGKEKGKGMGKGGDKGRKGGTGKEKGERGEKWRVVVVSILFMLWGS